MARIRFKADRDAESVGGGGGGSVAPKVRGIYGLQIVEASDGKRTSVQAKNPNVPMTNFRLEIADDDERGQLGAWVYHNVTWIPRGSGDKAAPGHGMAVHFLHAVNMSYDGEFDFDEQDFLRQEHAMITALLEVEPYVKEKDGRTYNNERFVIREIYTETNPPPDELPPPPRARAPQDARQAIQQRQDAKNGRASEEEVPF